MGKNSPSGYRRQGRKAFEEGVPRYECPFPKGSWEKEMHEVDWLEGWDQAAQNRGEDIKEEPIRVTCPHCQKQIEIDRNILTKEFLERYDL